MIEALHVVSVLFGGLGIIFEQPHKRSEISYYVLPRNLENIYNTMNSRNLVGYMPG
jgi:hypothetical protein